MPEKRPRARKPCRSKLNRLLDQVRELLRYHHYSHKTGQAYAGWMIRFSRVNATRHPATMGKQKVER